MAAHLRKIIFIFGGLNKDVVLLGAAFLALSVLDLIGLGLLGPFIALALDPEVFLNMEMMVWVGEHWMLPNTEALLVIVGSGLVILYIVKAIASIALQWAISQVTYGQQSRLRLRMMAAYLDAPFKVFLEKNSSEHVQSIMGNAGMFTENTLIPLFRAGVEFIPFIIILVFLVWLSPEGIVLFILLIGGIVCLYICFFHQRMKVVGEKLPVEGAAIIRNLRHALEGIREIRVLSAEKYFINIFSDPVRNYAKAMAYFVTVKDMSRHFFETAIVLFAVLFILFHTLQERQEPLLPLLSIFGVAAARLLPSFYIFLGSYNHLRFSQSAVNRLYDDLCEVDKIIQEKNLAREYVNANTNKEMFEKLELKGVRFRYPNGGSWVLQDLDFTLKKGEAIGVIGASGSGKTTLIDIILGLLDPQDGGCWLNGRDLHKNKAYWWSQTAYLPQMVFIIDDTLRCNVALGVPDDEIDEVVLLDALQQARISDLIDQLPQGLNTVLGEQGVRLSGGQRQRVALARAFYHGRDILVMDESTSALDSDAEKEIVDEIKQLKGIKTMIVIAHRFSTVRHCDRIIRLEAGRIVAQGSYEQVIGNQL